jgi:Cdc6-like AAA superfamily ATPase
VDIELNGRPVELNVVGSGRISRVKINQMNLKSFFESGRTTSEPNLPLPTPGETIKGEEAQSESTIGQLNGWRKVTILGSNGTGRTDVAKRVSRAEGSPTL